MDKRILKKIRSGLMLSVLATTAFTFTQNVSAKDLTANYTLVNDETENLVVKSGSNITIDLNGHNLTTTNIDAITVELGATVTIKGDGVVEARGGTNNASLYNNGKTTIEGGTFLKDESKGSYYAILNHGDLTINGGIVKLVNFTTSSLIDNGYYDYGKSTNAKTGYVAGTNMASPTLTINAGEFNGGLNTIKNDDGGILAINGGHFLNNIQFAVMNWNDATINDGVFEVPSGDEKTTVFNGTYGVDSKDIGSLKVNGGTFKAEYFLTGNTLTNIIINGGNLEITKGVLGTTKGGGYGNTLSASNVALKNVTSSVKPESGLIAEGYTIYNLDGKYVVDKKSSFTAIDEALVKVGETKDLQIVADAIAKKYLTVVIEDGTIASFDGTNIKGVKAGTTTVSVNLNDGTFKDIKVTVYNVASDSETKKEESSVTDSIADIIDGKKVDGIDDTTKDNIIDAVKAGSVIKTEIETKEISDTDLTEEVKKEISDIITNGEVVLKHFDINFLLKANNSVLGRLSILKTKVSISVDLPEDVEEVEEGYTRKYYVIRIHDGKAEKLEAELVDGKITFETDKFSNYTLTYVDTLNDNGNDNDKELDDVPKTSDTGKALILVISTLTYALGIKTLKRY